MEQVPVLFLFFKFFSSTRIIKGTFNAVFSYSSFIDDHGKFAKENTIFEEDLKRIQPET